MFEIISMIIKNKSVPENVLKYFTKRTIITLPGLFPLTLFVFRELARWIKEACPQFVIKDSVFLLTPL